VAQAKRRRFTADYKQRVLAEADHAKASGGVGLLLRREGLYSSLLATWRREREAGVLLVLAPQKRGPKTHRDSVAEENHRLRRDVERLTEDLRKADIVTDIQKKWPRCWVARSRAPTRWRSADGCRAATVLHCWRGIRL
jgi:transposase